MKDFSALAELPTNCHRYERQLVKSECRGNSRHRLGHIKQWVPGVEPEAPWTGGKETRLR